MYSISRVVCFLLLWSLSSATPQRSQPENPCRESLTEAQNTFLNAQGAIIKNHSSEVFSGSLNELKTRISVLQTELERFTQTTNARNAETESCIMALKNLTHSYASMENRMRAFQHEFEKHNAFERRTLLIRDAIVDIRNHRFLLADEKLAKLDDDAVHKVIHEVYARTEENLQLIKNFSSVVSNSSRYFSVLKYLSEEITKNNDTRILNLIRLARFMENDTISGHNTNRTLYKQITLLIETYSIQHFVRAMEIGHFSFMERIRMLLDALFEFRFEVFQRVMRRFIDEGFRIVKPRVILSNIFNRCSTAQAIVGIGQLSSKVREMGFQQHSALTINITMHLSQLRDRNDTATLTPEVRNSFDKTVSSLPKSARNLFFEKSVCFYNKARNVYIQAADEKYNYSPERRRVLAPTDRNLPEGSAWIPERQGDDMLFHSKKYPNEFLYFANFEYNTDLRYVFTWIAGGNRDNQSAFKIELIDDESCYLKSSRYNEYMFASDMTFEKDSIYSQVFAWRNGTVGGPESEFAWQIIGC